MQVNNSIEKIIFSSLKSLGYFKIVVLEKNENTYDLEADGNLRKILLKVRISHSPEMSRISTRSKDLTKFKVDAMNMHREPWIAQLHLDNEGQLSQSIKWQKLPSGSQYA